MGNEIKWFMIMMAVLVFSIMFAPALASLGDSFSNSKCGQQIQQVEDLEAQVESYKAAASVLYAVIESEGVSVADLHEQGVALEGNKLCLSVGSPEEVSCNDNAFERFAIVHGGTQGDMPFLQVIDD